MWEEYLVLQMKQKTNKSEKLKDFLNLNDVSDFDDVKKG